MKKSFVFCAALSALSALPVSAQVSVISAPILEGITSNGIVEQTIKYVMMIENQYQQIQNAYNQFQTLQQQAKMAKDNLKGVTNVKDYGSFMQWFNRQLYLERQAEERFSKMGIKIGGKTYTYKTISEIPNAAKTEFDPNNTFGKDMTEQEKKDVWERMGLQPANYAYLRTWQERDKALGKMIVTGLERITEENSEMAKGHDELGKKYAEDANASETDKITEKALAMDANILSMQTNKELGKLNEAIALQNEAQHNKNMQGQTPANAPGVYGWNKSMFDPIVEASEETE